MGKITFTVDDVYKPYTDPTVNPAIGSSYRLTKKYMESSPSALNDGRLHPRYKVEEYELNAEQKKELKDNKEINAFWERQNVLSDAVRKFAEVIARFNEFADSIVQHRDSITVGQKHDLKNSLENLSNLL